MEEAFVYKTTNLINGKIYIGVRTIQENSADASYLGSGLGIKADIKKYHRDNFFREIILTGTQEECYEFENLVVDRNFIKETTNYNQKVGGRISDGEYGLNNPSFKGYWRTPYGLFVSSTSAAEYIGCTKHMIQRRCKKNNPKTYWFVPKEEYCHTNNIFFCGPLRTEDVEAVNTATFSKSNNPMLDPKCRLKSSLAQPNQREVSIAGRTYRSVCEAARQLGYSKQKLMHRLKSDNYLDYLYLC